MNVVSTTELLGLVVVFGVEVLLVNSNLDLRDEDLGVIFPAISDFAGVCRSSLIIGETTFGRVVDDPPGLATALI